MGSEPGQSTSSSGTQREVPRPLLLTDRFAPSHWLQTARAGAPFTYVTGMKASKSSSSPLLPQSIPS